jgi:hypothetical protein
MREQQMMPGLTGNQSINHARIALTTSPLTSVNRKSRPL